MHYEEEKRRCRYEADIRQAEAEACCEETKARAESCHEEAKAFCKMMMIMMLGNKQAANND